MSLRIKITPDKLGILSTVRLFDGDRQVALTTMRHDVTLKSPEIAEFIRKHNHEPKVKS